MKRPLFIFALLLLSTSALYAGQVTLTTYYPAPTGNYDQMSANSLTLNDQGNSSQSCGSIGQTVLTSANGQLKVCSGGVSSPLNPWNATPWVANSIYTLNNVGIGTVIPKQKLDVKGDVNVPEAGGYRINNKSIMRTPFAAYGNTSSDAPTNLAIGYLALGGYSGYSGPGNTAVGHFALYKSTGFDNSAFGYRALASNEGGVAYGYQGLFNAAFGKDALYANQKGSYNSAFGTGALETNINGFDNSVFGYRALSGLGRDLLVVWTTTEGSENSVFGSAALAFLKKGSNNSVFGSSALYGFKKGDKNTVVGFSAGDKLRYGDNNILIGDHADVPAGTQSNFLNIGNTIYGDLKSGNVGIGVTAPQAKLDVGGNAIVGGTVTAVQYLTSSDRRLKENIKPLGQALDTVEHLQGVTFNWKKDGSKEIGVIAQEVEAVVPELVATDKDGMKSVKYGNMAAILIEAVKEQQEQIGEQRQQIDGLNKRIETLEKQK